MTGTVDGQHAPDPGDHNVSISGKDKEQEAPARPKDTSPEQGDPGEDPQEEEDEPEDTSPPIQVGQPQDLSEIRKKVIKLLGKN